MLGQRRIGPASVASAEVETADHGGDKLVAQPAYRPGPVAPPAVRTAADGVRRVDEQIRRRPDLAEHRPAAREAGMERQSIDLVLGDPANGGALAPDRAREDLSDGRCDHGGVRPAAVVLGPSGLRAYGLGLDGGLFRRFPQCAVEGRLGGVQCSAGQTPGSAVVTPVRAELQQHVPPGGLGAAAEQ